MPRDPAASAATAAAAAAEPSPPPASTTTAAADQAPDDVSSSSSSRAALQGCRKGDPNHPRRRRDKPRDRPRAAGLAPAALQAPARLALCGFAGDPGGYDAVLARMHEACEAFVREFGELSVGGGDEAEDNEENEEEGGAPADGKPLASASAGPTQRKTPSRTEAARAARCAFYHAYASNPFACPGCWLLPGLCVCDAARADLLLPAPPPPADAPAAASPALTPPPPQPMPVPVPLPPAVACVVVHAHHGEWRRASSTGCLAPLVLRGAGGGGGGGGGGGEDDGGDNDNEPPPSSSAAAAAVLSLMAGHAPHDALLASMVADPRWLPVLLFPRRPPSRRGRTGAAAEGPGEEGGAGAAAPSASLDEVVARALALKKRQQQQDGQHQRQQLPLLLIVPDGTWQQARRLSLRYGPWGSYHDSRLQFLELPREAVAAVAARGGGGGENAAEAAATADRPTLPQQNQKQQRTVSLLAPARLYRGADKCPQRVSTAEALAAALEGLEAARARAVDEDEGDKEEGARRAEAAVRALVRAVQLKVAAVRLQSGRERPPPAPPLSSPAS